MLGAMPESRASVIPASPFPPPPSHPSPIPIPCLPSKTLVIKRKRKQGAHSPRSPRPRFTPRAHPASRAYYPYERKIRSGWRKGLVNLLEFASHGPLADGRRKEKKAPPRQRRLRGAGTVRVAPFVPAAAAARRRSVRLPLNYVYSRLPRRFNRFTVKFTSPCPR